MHRLDPGGEADRLGELAPMNLMIAFEKVVDQRPSVDRYGIRAGRQSLDRLDQRLDVDATLLGGRARVAPPPQQ